MPKLKVKRRAYDRDPYTRKDGTHVSGAHVPASTFKVKDRGKWGRTPKSERWYNPQVETGWRKNESPRTRRMKSLRAHGHDLLATARSLQALSNVTTDKTTKRLAAQDARYFFARYKKGR